MEGVVCLHSFVGCLFRLITGFNPTCKPGQQNRTGYRRLSTVRITLPPTAPQGPVPNNELTQLLQDATSTCDKAEQEYLYTVSGGIGGRAR